MVKRLSRRVAVLVGALALMGAWTTASAPAASASPFCHGQTVTGYQYCYGAARNLSGVQGWGAQSAVCIGAGAIWGGCAPVGVLKQMNLGYTIHAQPWISGNGGGPTVVYGSTW